MRIIIYFVYKFIFTGREHITIHSVSNLLGTAVHQLVNANI